MHQLATRAYGEVSTRTANDKSIEYALFEQITQELEALADMSSPPIAEWAEIISRNMKLWTLLQIDILHPENSLDLDTKRGLSQLAIYVREASTRILGGEGDIATLVDINRTVMAGLTQTNASQSSPAQAVA